MNHILFGVVAGLLVFCAGAIDQHLSNVKREKCADKNPGDTVMVAGRPYTCTGPKK